jgi:hypothetical protein
MLNNKEVSNRKRRFRLSLNSFCALRNLMDEILSIRVKYSLCVLTLSCPRGGSLLVEEPSGLIVAWRRCASLGNETKRFSNH